MPANPPIWKGYSAGNLIETVGSGTIHCAERVTYKQQFAGRKADAIAFALAHPRASQWWLLVNGAYGLFYVEESNCETEKGGKGIVTVTYTYLGIVPPDEFALTPFEINPAIQKNLFFAGLTDDDVKAARQAFDSATSQGQTSITNAISTRDNAGLILELVNKWLRGEETYYLAGFTFAHTLFFSAAPIGDKGGYIQQPYGPFSPYVAQSGIQWLRLADEVTWSNGLWKLTRQWKGGPEGQWDTDLYPG